MRVRLLDDAGEGAPSGSWGSRRRMLVAIGVTLLRTASGMGTGEVVARLGFLPGARSMKDVPLGGKTHSAASPDSAQEPTGCYFETRQARLRTHGKGVGRCGCISSSHDGSVCTGESKRDGVRHTDRLRPQGPAC